MRDDLASPNLGSAPKDYNATFFNRTLKAVELTIARFLSKGPVQITDLTVDDITVTDDVTVAGDLTVAGASTFTGSATFNTNPEIATTAPVLTLRDTNSADINYVGYTQYLDSVGTRLGYIGYGSSSNNLLHINNETADGELDLRTSNVSRLNISTTAVTAKLATTITANSVPLLTLDRTGNSINSVTAYTNTSGTVYAGHGAANTFSIGGSANLATGGNNWMDVTTNKVTIHGGSDVNVQPLEIISTNADASFGPDLSLYRNSATPAAVDTLGFYSFFGNNSAAEKIRYSGVAGGINTTTDGAEEGRLYLQTAVAGNGTNVVIIDGEVVDLTKGQLKFPATQNASSNANTLDDYEEGDWTPVVIGATTAGTGTYSSQTGTYTKIGNLVFITALVGITAHTGTGGMRISGLPFAGAVTNHTLAVWTSGMTSATQTLTSGSVILFYAAPNSATVMDLAADTNWSLRVSGCYVTS